MKIYAIIQARTGSTRLKEKVLREMMDKPLLWHLINQVNYSSLIDDVVIATTKKKDDDVIEKFANKYSFKIYRGSENDILDRFYQSAKMYNVDVIVRIWGDCPLIDPKLIDKSLKNFIDNKYDYCNNFNPSTYPFGMNFEIYTFETLEKIWNMTNFYRRYPFEYIYDHKNLFKSLYDKNDNDLSCLRLTVDYIDDFKLIEKIFMHLYSKQKAINMQDILDFFDKNPELKGINEGLERNIEYKNELKLKS